MDHITSYIPGCDLMGTLDEQSAKSVGNRRLGWYTHGII